MVAAVVVHYSESIWAFLAQLVAAAVVVMMMLMTIVGLQMDSLSVMVAVAMMMPVMLQTFAPFHSGAEALAVVLLYPLAEGDF